MQPESWIGLGSLVVITINQFMNRLFTQRTKRVEDALDKINRHRSSEEDKIQAQYWKTTESIAMLKERVAVLEAWKNDRDRRRNERESDDYRRGHG